MYIDVYINLFIASRICEVFVFWKNAVTKLLDEHFLGKTEALMIYCLKLQLCKKISVFPDLVLMIKEETEVVRIQWFPCWK